MNKWIWFNRCNGGGGGNTRKFKSTGISVRYGSKVAFVHFAHSQLFTSTFVIHDEMFRARLSGNGNIGFDK